VFAAAVPLFITMGGVCGIRWSSAASRSHITAVASCAATRTRSPPSAGVQQGAAKDARGSRNGAWNPLSSPTLCRVRHRRTP